MAVTSTRPLGTRPIWPARSAASGKKNQSNKPSPRARPFQLEWQRSTLPNVHDALPARGAQRFLDSQATNVSGVVQKFGLALAPNGPSRSGALAADGDYRTRIEGRSPPKLSASVPMLSTSEQRTTVLPGPL